LITALVNEVILNIQLVIDAGVSILVALLDGIANAIPQIAAGVGNIIVTFINELGKWTLFIMAVGTNMLVAIIDGMRNNLAKIGDAVTAFFTDPVNGLFVKLESWWEDIKDEGIELGKRILEGLVDDAVGFLNFAGEMIVKLLDGIEQFIRDDGQQIIDGGKGIADAIIDGIIEGLNLDRVLGAVGNVASGIIDFFKGPENLDSKSPSKVFIKEGKNITDGLAVGIGKANPKVKSSVKGLAQSTIKAFGDAMSGIQYDLAGMEEFNPTFTPVLDLTRVGKDAKGLSSLLGGNTFGAEVSSLQAQYLAKAQKATPDAEPTSAAAAVTQIKFEQTINSPTALTPNDIYRSTKSQLAIAKEELKL